MALLYLSNKSEIIIDLSELKRRLIFFLILLSGTVLYSQESYVVSGSVKDSITGEPLVGATLLINTSGTTADEDGNFRITVRSGDHMLKVSYIGYTTKNIALTVIKDITLNLLLSPAATITREVIVTAKNPAENTESTKTGIVELSGKEIKKLPSLMGEADLIRALNYSPGVQGASDGNTGFYVRGGNVDQNLILLDNAIVYNPSHVLGFFSIFNPDIVSNATLIKSGIPSNYGGRLSSVLYVKTMDGNFEKLSASGTLGLIFSKATIQGPVIKDKLSFFVSFRKTYINEVVKPLLGTFMNVDSGSVLSGSTYGMYDLNAKLTGKIGSRNRLSLLLYKGGDNFKLVKHDIDYTTRINWGNTLLAFNWNYVISDSSFLLNSLSYSNYSFNYKADQSFMGVDLYSSIRNLNYRLEYSRSGEKLGTVKTGVEAKYYTFVPNRFMLSINQEKLNYSSYQDLYAGEFAVFASWEKDISRKLRIYGGLRLNNYRQLGPYEEITDEAGSLIRDTVNYRSFETVNSYTCLEPRFSIRYQTGTDASVKASYTRNYQFIHVASASAVTMPSDIWIPSTKHTKPQFGDQFTLGYYRNFSEDTYVTSIEAYYKRLRNQVELLYGLGASLQDVSFENSLTSGKGYAAGIEISAQKQKGKLTGSLSYALSYSERQFDEINDGDPFPAKYDRRHAANLTAGYRLNDRWDFSIAFIYATGNAMTVPVQIYLVNSNIITQYSKTNSFRVPPYHRMDISVNYYFRQKGRFESSLNFSVFNVYNRANTFLIYFDIQGDILYEHRLDISARQISIFPIMPSLSWNLKF